MYFFKNLRKKISLIFKNDRSAKEANRLRLAYVTTMRGINILYNELINEGDEASAKRLLHAKIAIQATYNKALLSIAKKKIENG